MALISLQEIRKRYEMGAEVIRALDGLTLSVDAGEYVAVMGTSGSGKSTLMNIIGCLDTPTSGTYKLNGVAVEELDDDQLSTLRNREIGFVFQTFNLLARTTALSNVELPLVYSKVSKQERRERASNALERVGLGDRMGHKTNELSGGQRQRVAVARALVNKPSILLADEPTGNLDTATSDEIMQLFDDLHSEGNTIILVTHEPEIADFAERKVVLRDGNILTDEPVRRRTIPAADSKAAPATPAAP